MDADRRPVGMIQIDTRDQMSRFSQEDLDLLGAIAGPVGLAVENSRLHEDLVRLTVIEASLQNARSVQLALLPEHRPEVPGYEFFDAYEPADKVGGDYYDYFPERTAAPIPRFLTLAIGDVAGKGMPAALMVAKLASEVRTCLLTESDPVLAMQKLNRQLSDARFPERFITFALIELDTQAHTLRLVNAGHMTPVIRRANGRIEAIGEDEFGPPLAVIDDATYTAVEATLHRGDFVVLHTDGVPDAMDPEDRRFRNDRFLRTIQNAGPGAEAIVRTILQTVREHAAGAPQTDDIGIVCFGRR